MCIHFQPHLHHVRRQASCQLPCVSYIVLLNSAFNQLTNVWTVQPFRILCHIVYIRITITCCNYNYIFQNCKNDNCLQSTAMYRFNDKSESLNTDQPASTFWCSKYFCPYGAPVPMVALQCEPCRRLISSCGFRYGRHRQLPREASCWGRHGAPTQKKWER